MGSTRKGDAERSDCRRVVGEVQGSARNTSWSKARCRRSFLTMTRLIFAGLILLTLSFVHGDKIFSIINNHKDAISLLIFFRGWRANCTAHFFC